MGGCVLAGLCGIAWRLSFGAICLAKRFTATEPDSISMMRARAVYVFRWFTYVIFVFFNENVKKNILQTKCFN